MRFFSFRQTLLCQQRLHNRYCFNISPSNTVYDQNWCSRIDRKLKVIQKRRVILLGYVSWVLWYINPYWLYITKSCLYNYFKYVLETNNILIKILPFRKKGDLGLAKNYRSITLTSIAATIYNALIRKRREPKIDNILRKNQNGFRRNRSTTSQILTIRRILEGVRAKKKPTGDITICRLYQGLRFHSQREDGTNQTGIRPTKKNKNKKNRSSNNDSL